MNTMTARTAAVLLLSCALAGCGWFDRKVTANITGYSTACVDGVRYLQFPSGVTVQYDRDGRVRTC